jgi:hypothetical protein
MRTVYNLIKIIPSLAKIFVARIIASYRSRVEIISEGKQVIMYLDDGLGIEQDDELCKAVVVLFLK